VGDLVRFFRGYCFCRLCLFFRFMVGEMLSVFLACVFKVFFDFAT